MQSSSQRLTGQNGQNSQFVCCTSMIISSLCFNIKNLCKETEKKEYSDPGIAMLEEEKKGCTDSSGCRKAKAAGLMLICIPVTLFGLVADCFQGICSPFFKCKKQESTAASDSYKKLTVDV